MVGELRKEPYDFKMELVKMEAKPRLRALDSILTTLEERCGVKFELEKSFKSFDVMESLCMDARRINRDIVNKKCSFSDAWFDSKYSQIREYFSFASIV